MKGDILTGQTKDQSAMKPYGVFSLVLAGMLLHMCNALGADLSIKGVYLNQPRDAFVSAHPQATCFNASMCSWTDTLGGASGTFIASFDEDLVESLTVSDFDATEFDNIVAAVVTKFGKPKQSQSGVSTSAMGAKFDNRRITWLGKGWQLQMDKRSDSVLKSSFVCATAKAVRKFGASSAAKKDDI